MPEVKFEEVSEVGISGGGDADKKKLAASRIIYATALQLGVDVVRELYDCGNLSTSIKEEQMDMNGVRALLYRSIASNI